MRKYGAPPSNQTQLDLPGLSQEGQELMEDARRWAARHWDEWQWYKNLARRECMESKDGKASPNYCLQAMRRQFRCEIPNAYAPCLARMAMEQSKNIRFRLAKSKVDGFTEAVL